MIIFHGKLAMQMSGCWQGRADEGLSIAGAAAAAVLDGAAAVAVFSRVAFPFLQFWQQRCSSMR